MRLIHRFIITFCLWTSASTLPAKDVVSLWNKSDDVKQWKHNKLYVFLPEEQKTTNFSVIICPGGSYYWRDINNEGFSVARYLNNHGITAFVLHYRTAKNGVHFPAMIEDLQQAMRYLKTKEEEYTIDINKVGIMGFSAGGHLAGVASTYFDFDFKKGEKLDSSSLLKPYFTAMIYPVVSMEDSICHKKSRKNLLGKTYSPKTAKSMSLELNVRNNMSPVFLLHCIGDRTVDYRNSVVFSDALKVKNIKHEFHLLDEDGHGGHGFGIKPNGKATGWIDKFLTWITDLIEN